MLEFFQGNELLTWWAAIAAVFLFVATLLLVPMILIRLPGDYFNRRHRERGRDVTGHPVARMAFVISKNAIGIVFVVLGVVMLVLPGQGLLTIVVGLMLLDFPGKYEVELWVVRRPSILRAINWIRSRAHKPPLEINV